MDDMGHEKRRFLKWASFQTVICLAFYVKLGGVSWSVSSLYHVTICRMSWYFLYMYGLSFIIIFLLLSHTPTFLIVVWRSERGIYDGSRSWAINSGPPTFRWTQGSLDFHGLKAQPTPRRRSPWNLLGGLYPIFTTCNWERWNVFLLDNFQWCISKCTFDFASPDRSDKLMDGRYDK